MCSANSLGTLCRCSDIKLTYENSHRIIQFLLSLFLVKEWPIMKLNQDSRGFALLFTKRKLKEKTDAMKPSMCFKTRENRYWFQNKSAPSDEYNDLMVKRKREGLGWLFWDGPVCLYWYITCPMQLLNSIQFLRINISKSEHIFGDVDFMKFSS